MASPRVRKVQKLLAREISQLLAREIKDPRVNGITVVEVKATGDLKRAVIFYRVMSDDPSAREEAANGLQSATGAIKRMLGDRVRLKFTPELVFKYDPTVERARRIEALLEEIKEKKVSG